MPLHYKETKEEIIREGVIAREMWKQYPHGKEHVSYAELAKACRLMPSFPIVVERTHDHEAPLYDAAAAVGRVDVRPCDKTRGVYGVLHFEKSKLTPEEQQYLRQQHVPVSVYQFVDTKDGEQLNLLFNHLMVTETLQPRCPPYQCGIGVYDAMSEKEEEKKKPDEKAVSEPVSEKQEENQKAETPEEQAPTADEVLDKTEELKALKQRISELEAAKAVAEAELAAEREPLEGVLLQRGLSKEAIHAMSLKDLQTAASALRSKDTQGLPGAVPAPREKEKSYLEQKAERDAKFLKDLEAREKEKFDKW